MGFYYLSSCRLIEAKGMFSALLPPSFSEKGNRGPAIEQVGGVLEAPCSCKQSAITRLLLSPSIYMLSASALRSWPASH